MALNLIESNVIESNLIESNLIESNLIESIWYYNYQLYFTFYAI